MPEIRRTFVYVVVAAVSMSVAFAVYRSTKPQPLAEFEKVGQEFFPEFNDPNAATSLTVSGFDAEKATIRSFSVELKDGRWTIPSQYGYPADAQQRLAKTASSIIGIKRGALASRNIADHERFNVVDPTVTETTSLNGRGSRITIKKGDTVLADYIIGKKAPTAQGRYYVRAPGEKETYIADFDPELSTKFEDWIDVDLLKIEQDKLISLIIDKYTLDEQEGRLKDREVTVLDRDKFGDPWQLKDLDTAKDEVNTTEVTNLIRTLSELKIVGVRPKPQGLNPDLSFDPKIVRSQLAFQTIQTDLIDKGFFLIQRETENKDDEPELDLIAQEGSFKAAMNDGVVYDLHFGEVFTGDLSEIEIGKPADDEAAAEDKEPEEEKAIDLENPLENGKKQSRFVFVKVKYDPTYLGPEPVKPTEPTPPPELSEKPAEKKDESTTPEADKKEEAVPEKKEEQPGDNSGGTLNLDEPAAEEAPLVAPKPDQKPAEEMKKEDPVAKFELLKKQYEANLRMYEQQLADYEKRKVDGQARAKLLNERLGEWYYVVPAENVQTLRAERSRFIKAKGAPETEPENLNLPNIPEGLKLPN